MKSALDPFVEAFENNITPKGFCEGRDGIAGRPDLTQYDIFDRSLRAAERVPRAPYTMTVNGIKIPINTSGSSQPQSVPVKTWHSASEVLEVIQEYLDEVEEEKRLDPEQEKIDAYDRAMSIL